MPETPDLPESFAAARTALAGAPRVRLGAVIAPRRVLGIARAPRIAPVGEAWHLGVLLLTDDTVLATGDILRAREDAPRGFTAESQRERADAAAAARRGGFAEGETAHVGWEEIDLDAVASGAASGPFIVQGGVVMVRWSTAGGLRPLAGYLSERVELLRNPPQRAT